MIRKRHEKRQMKSHKSTNESQICQNETVFTSFPSYSFSYHGLQIKMFQQDSKIICTCGVGYPSFFVEAYSEALTSHEVYLQRKIPVQHATVGSIF